MATTVTRLEVEPIDDRHLGATVSGLQAADFTPRDIAALQQILAQYGVVVLRDQKLTPYQYVAFAQLFGEIEPSTRELYWLPEKPEIYVISNVVENGRPIGNANDGFFWHTDQYYFPRPTAYTFLYSIESPPEGAETKFCSTYRLYDALTAEQKAEYESISIIGSHAKLTAKRVAEGKAVDAAEADKCPDVVHPLVRTHPLTGRKFLYFSAIRASMREGVSEAEFESFLADLFAKATDEDHVYSHKWRDGDVVIWDNRGLLHRASPYNKDRHRRIAHRLSVIGERPY